MSCTTYFHISAEVSRTHDIAEAWHFLQFFTFKRVAGVLSIHVNLEQVPQHPPVSLTLFDLHSMRFQLASFWTQSPQILKPILSLQLLVRQVFDLKDQHLCNKTNHLLCCSGYFPMAHPSTQLHLVAAKPIKNQLGLRGWLSLCHPQIGKTLHQLEILDYLDYWISMPISVTTMQSDKRDSRSTRCHFCFFFCLRSSAGNLRA